MATMTSTWVQQEAAMGTTYVDTVMASMTLVRLGLPLWQLTALCLPWKISWTLTRCGPP